ncbi:MAG: hypothetical protein KKB20_08575 [Proteobacteria bacterium]|nr:hypothetical protein [Pseudomonadota bacterium]
MDVGLHDHTVDSNLASFLDMMVLGPANQGAIDCFPGLRAYHFDILGQNRMLESPAGQTDPDKPAERVGIRKVKGQVSIAEDEHLPDQGGPKDLIRRYAARSGPFAFPAPI